MTTSKPRPDRRVRRTQRLLSDALINLAIEKGYDNVTIRDITERADLAYSTFFRHYPDKDALLDYILRAIVWELRDLVLQAEQDPAEGGRLIFASVREHAALYRVLLGGQGSHVVLRRVEQTITEQVMSQQQPNGVVTAETFVPLEVAANHLMTATLGMIRWWLEGDMPYSPETMGRIYSALVLEPVERLAFGTDSLH